MVNTGQPVLYCIVILCIENWQVFLCGTVERRVELLALLFAFFFPILKTSYKSMFRGVPVSLPLPILGNFFHKKLCFSGNNRALVKGQSEKPKALGCSPLDILQHYQLSQWHVQISGNLDLF